MTLRKGTRVRLNAAGRRLFSRMRKFHGRVGVVANSGDMQRRTGFAAVLYPGRSSIQQFRPEHLERMEGQCQVSTAPPSGR